MHHTNNHTFASDNYSGIHPTILQAISDANHGHQSSYGHDTYSQKLDELIKQHFGKNASAYPVFNGTGANITALSAMMPRFGAVICADTAHIEHDESAAPQYIGGFKPLVLTTTDGKLTPELIDACLSHRDTGEHKAKPAALYLSLTTELGTCYTLDELRLLVACAKKWGLFVYVDGARLANACAHLHCTLQDIADVGMDIVSLGGTKNGLMIGECIIVLNPQFAENMKYLRKLHMQLGSKLRFIAAQFITWLETGLWLQLASHSNQMATRLAQGLSQLEGITITQKVQSNAVFVILPKHIKETLRQNHHFYDWNAAKDEVRLMTSFDTTAQQVDAFIADAKSLLNQ